MNPCTSETAVEIRKAVDFFIDEVQQRHPDYEAFPAFAEEILNIHIQNNASCGLCFWRVDMLEKEPLWLRVAFLDKLRELRDYPTATIVIFGLQDTVMEDKQYWTHKVDERYAEIRDYLESLAAENQQKDHKLNLIYV